MIAGWPSASGSETQKREAVYAPPGSHPYHTAGFAENAGSPATFPGCTQGCRPSGAAARAAIASRTEGVSGCASAGLCAAAKKSGGAGTQRRLIVFHLPYHVPFRTSIFSASLCCGMLPFPHAAFADPFSLHPRIMRQPFPVQPAARIALLTCSSACGFPYPCTSAGPRRAAAPPPRRNRTGSHTRFRSLSPRYTACAGNSPPGSGQSA